MAKIRLLVSVVIFVFLNNYLNAQGKSSQAHINLGRNVNSEYDEQNPVLSPDGNVLYFTIAKHPENEGGKKDNGDIWVSKKDAEGNWGEKTRLTAPINNKSKNAVLAVLDNGNSLLLQGIYTKGGTSVLSQGISVSRKSGGEWSFPTPLAIDYYMNKSENLGISITADGEVMILSLESYGSFGAEDLYVSFKQNGKWSDPRNLGPKINTAMQELSPYLAQDGKTLYFSSNGRKGFGSKDIYASTRLDNTWLNWSEPINLGSKVNSAGSETFFIHPGKGSNALVVSTQNSDGFGDINLIKYEPEDQMTASTGPGFMIETNAVTQEKKSGRSENMMRSQNELEEAGTDKGGEESENVKTLELYGNVKDAKSQRELKADISLFYAKQEVFKTTTGNLGDYVIQLPKVRGNYVLEVRAKGYYELDKKVLIDGNTEDFSLDFYLIPLEVGTTIQLDNILFEQGTAELLDDVNAELDKVINMMKEYPIMEIELSGHTDNSGAFKLNLELSEARAEVIRKMLIERGVDEKRVTAKGYGSTKPIASNQNEDSRKMNRRVEFTIMKL